MLEQAKLMFQKLLKLPFAQSNVVIVGATGLAGVVIAAVVLVGTSSTDINRVDPQNSPKGSIESSSSTSGDTDASATPSNTPSASPSASGSRPSASSSPSRSSSSSTLAPPTERQLDAMQMAVNAFENYNWSPHSRISLIQTLESFGFSLEDSRYAVYAIDVNWNSTAEFYAQDFLGNGPYSKQAVISLLRAEEFTLAEATFGVNAISADWVQEAIDLGEYHIYGYGFDGTRYSRSRMITLITNAGFTQSEASQAADYFGDGTWAYEARMMAYDVYYASSPEYAALIQALVNHGFSQAHSELAANEVMGVPG